MRLARQDRGRARGSLEAARPRGWVARLWHNRAPGGRRGDVGHASRASDNCAQVCDMMCGGVPSKCGTRSRADVCSADVLPFFARGRRSGAMPCPEQRQHWR